MTDPVTAFGDEPSITTANTFDPGDRLTGIDDKIDSTRNRTFGYDDLNRLTSATGPFQDGLQPIPLAYGYDSLGNLTCKDAASAGGTCDPGPIGSVLVYPGGSAPRAHPHSPDSVNGVAISYDGAGNVLNTPGGRTYNYDAHGRIQEARDASNVVIASFGYDGNGALAKITDNTSGSAVVRWLMGPDFEWNQTASVGRIHIRLGDQVIATHEEAYAGPSGGGCAGSGPAMPGHGPDLWGPLVLFFPGALALLLAWLGSLIAFKERGQRARAAMALATVGAFVWATVVPLGHLGEAAYASSPASVTYYHPDHLGSSIVTSSTFTSPPPPPQYVLYRPYGGVVAPTAGGSTAAPQFGFTGQRFEASVGIYDYGARWYDPALGRFLQADSMVPDPTDTQSLNRYSYVRNDPLGRIDPGGSWDLSGAFASVGGFISDYVGQPLAQFGSGLYDGFAYEYFGGPPPQPGSSWFYNQGLGVSSLLSQPVNVAAYGAGTALEAMGRVLPLAGVPYALAAPFTGVGMTLQDDSVQWALYADQYNRLDLGQRTGASWLADDIASLGFGGFGNAGGLLDGAAGVLTGAFAGDPGLIKGSAIGFIDSIVPRYGLRAGPGWPAPIDDSARPPFWNAGDIPALPHDMDYSVPGPRFGADRAIAGAVWDWSLPQPGPVGQVYRALLSGLFIGKAYTWDQLTDPPAESR